MRYCDTCTGDNPDCLHCEYDIYEEDWEAYMEDKEEYDKLQFVNDGISEGFSY